LERVRKMTDVQAASIRELRMKGMGYRAIASVLGLSRDIVRNYCKSKGVAGYGSVTKLNIREQMQNGCVCIFCGNVINQHSPGRPKKFCTDKCRREWWKLHPESVNKKDTAVYHLTCSHCGKAFDSYGNKKRKYCSHNCYIKDRFWEEEEDGI